MILIISRDLDNSTDEVERWLKFYETPFIRINADYLSTQLEYIDLYDNVFGFRGGMKIMPEKIKVVYARKWFPNDYLQQYDLDGRFHSIVSSVKQENMELGAFFKTRLQHAKWVNEGRQQSFTKIDQILLANDCGLKTPKTIITSQKKIVSDFAGNSFRVITKPFLAHFSLEQQDKLFVSYTEIVDDAFLRNLSETFYPSLFQEYIEKKFEVRVFYLDGVFFALTYFTQQNKATLIDSKKGNSAKSYKTQILDLPSELKEKLNLFMNKANLITGSFDLIYNMENEFVFVEVNPSGIYENVSHLGNFNIEKILAQKLIQYNNEY